MPEYTITSALACLVVIVLELVWLKTGLFRTRAFWIGWAIVAFFQCLMDGWLTKLTAPVVIYNEKFASGWRFPWDIPVEDFMFGFALITLALLFWVRGDAKFTGSPLPAEPAGSPLPAEPCKVTGSDPAGGSSVR